MLASTTQLKDQKLQLEDATDEPTPESKIPQRHKSKTPRGAEEDLTFDRSEYYTRLHGYKQEFDDRRKLRED